MRFGEAITQSLRVMVSQLMLKLGNGENIGSCQCIEFRYAY
jgi:hypothetical protein